MGRFTLSDAYDPSGGAPPLVTPPETEGAGGVVLDGAAAAPALCATCPTRYTEVSTRLTAG